MQNHGLPAASGDTVTTQRQAVLGPSHKTSRRYQFSCICFRKLLKISSPLTRSLCNEQAVARSTSNWCGLPVMTAMFWDHCGVLLVERCCIRKNSLEVFTGKITGFTS